MKCDICGKNDDSLSEIRFTAYRGSEHDGQQVTYSVCGDCFDWFLNSMPQDTGTRKTIVPWDI